MSMIWKYDNPQYGLSKFKSLLRRDYNITLALIKSLRLLLSEKITSNKSELNI